MKYYSKTSAIDAVQWFKNGDHPQDNCQTFIATGDFDMPAGTPFQGEGHIVRYFRHPEVNGDKACAKCGHIMHNHGFIDTPGLGHTVCPGDYVVTTETGKHFPCKPDVFERLYVKAE